MGFSGTMPTAEAQQLVPPPPSTSATQDVAVRSAYDASDSISLLGQLGALSIATPPPAPVPQPTNLGSATAGLFGFMPANVSAAMPSDSNALTPHADANALPAAQPLLHEQPSQSTGYVMHPDPGTLAPAQSNAPASLNRTSFPMQHQCTAPLVSARHGRLGGVGAPACSSTHGDPGSDPTVMYVE